MVKFVFILMFFTTTTSLAGERMRQFSGEGSSKFWFLEKSQGDEKSYYFKMSNLGSDYDNQVFKMKKDAGKENRRRFATSGKVVPVAVYDYKKKSLQKGSIVHLWEVYVGQQKYEFTEDKSTSITGPQFLTEYSQFQLGSTLSGKKANAKGDGEKLLSKSCKGPMTLKIENGKKNDLTVFAFSQGVSDLCLADNDYREAIAEGRSMTLQIDSSDKVTLVDSEKRIVKVGLKTDNLRSMVRKVLTDGL